ncbi:hypothetical protein [Paenibacillus odorifer]|uniref:hypothetical protein n=1 Tax=Paenibacillus odorifer TaxID=189426 RepID=UPI00096FAFF4|nr:hypothetical protein [Paenibacillus odorifer]OME13786.1 hypothetical protein BSK57_29405 [Paenibacillus odorifer]
MELNHVDKMLISEVNEELQIRYGLNKEKAEKLISESSLLRMLMQRSDFVHHEGPESWASIIASNNKLKTVPLIKQKLLVN